MRCVAVLLLATAMGGAGELSKVDQTTALIARRVDGAIAAVRVKRGRQTITVSGLAVNTKGDVLTLRFPFQDQHGTLKLKRANLMFPGERASIAADVIHDDKQSGTVLLRPERKPKRSPKPLRARPSDLVRDGEWVMLVGNLVGTGSEREISVSLGVISGVRYGGRKTVVELHASTMLNQGTLGAPVVDLRGRLIGVTAPKVTDAGGQAVILPWDRVAERYAAIKGEIGRMFKVARAVRVSPSLPESFAHVVRTAAARGAKVLVGVRAGAATSVATPDPAPTPTPGQGKPRRAPPKPVPVPGARAGADRSSGVVVSADGLIVCPLRVTGWPGPVRKLIVDLPDGRMKKAERVGYDERLRIALLKIDAKGLALLPHVPPAEQKQGRFAIALGFPHESPEQQTPLVTFGLLSRTRALGHLHPAFGALQTDAAVSGGNRGGPLVDIEGRLLGVLLDVNDTDPAAYGARARGRYGRNCGLGFAIPVQQLGKLVARMAKGDVLRTAFFGVSVVPVEGGLRIVRLVEKNSKKEPTAATQAGLKKDDVILKIDGTPMKDGNTFRRTLAGYTVGDEITIVFRRDGKDLTAKGKMTAR